VGRWPDEEAPEAAGESNIDRRDFLKRVGVIVGGMGIASSPLLRAGSAFAAESGGSLGVWYLSQSPAEIKLVQGFSNAFGRRAGLAVKVAPYGYDAFNKAFPLALRAGKGPDVAYAAPGKDTTVKFGNAGLLLDLTAATRQRGWSKHIRPEIIRYWNRPGNRTWSIPYDVVTVGNFYNKQILDKLKIAPPRTFAAYEAMLAKLKANGVTPFAVGGKEFTAVWMIDQLSHTLVPFSYLDRINNLLDPKATWNVKGMVRAASIVQSWAEKGYFQDGFLGMSTTDADNLFLNGGAAIDVTGSWNNSNFVAQAKFPVRFFPTPRVNTRLPWHLGGFTPNNGWTIPKAAKQQDKSLAYLDYVLGEKVARDLWNSGDVVAYQFTKVPPAKNALQRDVYNAMQKGGLGLYGAGGSAELGNAWVSVVQELITGRLKPQEAIDKIEATYRKVTKR
jgi:raffinose/stachyose/melibiose transport system substrate-binding protein